MNRIPKNCLLLVFIVLFLASCREAPVTERKQLILIPESSEIKLGEDAFRKILRESTLSNDRDMQEKIRKVGSRIAKVSGRPGYKWEFVLIEDRNTVNAFCLPGGKVGIYSGILPYTKDEEGLAVVIGHEVGHAIARHGAERMSTALVSQLGQIALNMIVDVENPIVLDALNRAYGLATSLGVILPFSRKQELEADRISISLMKDAGYHPRAALYFWTRMKQGRREKEPPAYLSTHPLDEKRIAEMEKILLQGEFQQ